MKGFLIEVNKDQIMAAVERGIVVITMDTENISITGKDFTSGSSLNWSELRLNEGDKVKIVVSQIEKSSAPLHSEPLCREEFEIFVYKWNEYAISELGWSRKLIYAITASGGRLLDKSGNIQGISGGMLEKKRGKTNTENNEEPDCGCSQKDDLCINSDGTHSWTSSCKSHKCKKVIACGTFWRLECDGICE